MLDTTEAGHLGERVRIPIAGQTRINLQHKIDKVLETLEEWDSMGDIELHRDNHVILLMEYAKFLKWRHSYNQGNYQSVVHLEFFRLERMLSKMLQYKLDCTFAHDEWIERCAQVRKSILTLASFYSCDEADPFFILETPLIEEDFERLHPTLELYIINKGTSRCAYKPYKSD